MDHAKTIANLYSAFQRGDIAFVLDQVDSNVQWEHWERNNSAQAAGVPWLIARRGREGAAEFFRVAGQMKFLEFNVLSVMASGNQGMGEIALEVELPGGTRLRDEEIHLFTFNDAGKIVRFRHYLDTAKHIAAAASATFA